MHPSSNQSNQTRPLTSREREVLRDISQGLSTKEIAERYAIAAGTVSAHRRSILKKTGCRNCTAAAFQILHT